VPARKRQFLRLPAGQAGRARPEIQSFTPVIPIVIGTWISNTDSHRNHTPQTWRFLISHIKIQQFSCRD